MAEQKQPFQVIVVKRKERFIGKAGSRGLGPVSDTMMDALYGAGEVVRPPFNMDEMADLTERTDVLYRVIQDITENVVGMGHEIVSRRKPRSGSDVTNPEEAEKPGSSAEYELLQRLFDEPNEKGRLFDDELFRFQVDRLSLGNGCLEITRDGSGQIDGLHHLPARTMRLRANPQGHIVGYAQVRNEQVQYYRLFGDESRRYAVTATRAGQKGEPNRKLIEKGRPLVVKACTEDGNDAEALVAKLKAEGEQNVSVSELTEVIWTTEYSSRRADYGIPPAAAAFEDIVGLANMKLWNSDLFENGTIPPAIIFVSGGTLAGSTRDEIISYLENEARGEYHRLAVISSPDEEAKITVEKLSDVSLREIGFIDGMDKLQKNIAMAYGVPFSRLTESTNRAPGQADADELRFREQNIRPKQRRLVRLINGLIVRGDLRVKDWEFKLLEGDITELRARSEAYERAARRGAVTIDEFRAGVFNLPPLPDGSGKIAPIIIPGQGGITSMTMLLMDEATREAIKRGESAPAAFNVNPGVKTPAKGELTDRLREAVERAGVEDVLSEADIEGVADALYLLEVS